MSLVELVRSKAPLLNKMFGDGSYQIETVDGGCVRVRAKWMELLLVYDSRNQFVSSAVRPLEVPEDLSEDHDTDTLLRFLKMNVGERRKSNLDDQQVMDELALVRPLAELLKDRHKSRDAVWFANGYSSAYTDYCGGKFASS
jgi:hypothetical protein